MFLHITRLVIELMKRVWKNEAERTKANDNLEDADEFGGALRHGLACARLGDHNISFRSARTDGDLSTSKLLVGPDARISSLRSWDKIWCLIASVDGSLTFRPKRRFIMSITGWAAEFRHSVSARFV